MTWVTVVYLVAASVLSGVGGAVVALAMWGDRFGRGFTRRRCPKCWFDLSATSGLQCPECGKTAREEKRLFRTRRRWWWAMVGAAMVVGGPAVAAWPTGDWFTLLPTSLKMRTWMYARDPEKEFAALVPLATTEPQQRRIMDGAMWWLVSGKSGKASRMANTPDSMLYGGYATWPLSDRGRDDLLKLLSAPELGYQHLAVQGVRYRSDLDERFYKVLSDLAADSPVRANVLDALKSFVADHEWARAALAKAIREGKEPMELYTAAESLLGMRGQDGPLLVTLYKEAGAEGRMALITASGTRKTDDPLVVPLHPLMLEEVVVGERRVAAAAMGVLVSAGPAIDPEVVEKLAAAEGEGLTRLVELTGKRKSRTAELVAALESVAAREGCTQEQRDAAAKAAETMRKKMEAAGGTGR